MTPDGPGGTLVAALLGLVFGLLVVPAVVAFVLLMAASGSYDAGPGRSKGQWFSSRAQRVGFGLGAAVGLVVLAGVLIALLGR